MRTKEEQEAINKACKFHPTTKAELQELVDDPKVYLGDIDTSQITDMSDLFAFSNRTDFSGIEKWNTSNVTDMGNMFSGCKNFKESLKSWDLTKAYNTNLMFEGCNIPKENLPQGIVVKDENTSIQLTDEIKCKLAELPKELIEQFLSQLQATSVNQENEQVQENVVNEVTSEEQQCEQVDVPASLKSNQDLSREF